MMHYINILPRSFSISFSRSTQIMMLLHDFPAFLESLHLHHLLLSSIFLSLFIFLHTAFFFSLHSISILSSFSFNLLHNHFFFFSFSYLFLKSFSIAFLSFIYLHFYKIFSFYSSFSFISRQFSFFCLFTILFFPSPVFFFLTRKYFHSYFLLPLTSVSFFSYLRRSNNLFSLNHFISVFVFHDALDWLCTDLTTKILSIWQNAHICPRPTDKPLTKHFPTGLDLPGAVLHLTASPIGGLHHFHPAYRVNKYVLPSSCISVPYCLACLHGADKNENKPTFQHSQFVEEALARTMSVAIY